VYVSFGWETSKFRIAKPAFKKPETPFYNMAQSIFRYLEPFIGVSHKCDRQTDRQIDVLTDGKTLS